MTPAETAIVRLHYAAACARAIEAAQAFMRSLDAMAALGAQVPGELWEADIAADAIRAVFADAVQRMPGVVSVFPDRSK